jgi:hypothetical protein
MERINARQGENVYAFLQRILVTSMLKDRQLIGIHNDKEIIVYPSSTIDSLCATWDAQRGFL